MSEWICETCAYYPPSSMGGKPCGYCEPADPLLNCYMVKEGNERVKETYWDKITKLNERQEKKGYEKYGVSLEENTTLTTEQRIEHLEEELIDGLKYCEHLKMTLAKDGITANDYQRAALRTAPDGDRLLQGVVGLGGEAGEILNLYEKHKCQGHELDKEKMAKECGDLLWYAALLATSLDYTLSEIMEMNIEKLKKRFPDGFDKARSINRKGE